MTTCIKCPTENKMFKIFQFYSASTATKNRMEETVGSNLEVTK